MVLVEDTFEHWLAQARAQLQRLPYALSVFSPAPVKPTGLFDRWVSGSRLDDVPKALWLAIWPLALLLVLFYLKGENGELVRYRVPPPQTPAREEILANPNVKV